MAQFKKVNVVYCYVRDWEGAKKFYRELLEWPVVFTDDQVGWEEYGMENETHIAINRWDSPDRYASAQRHNRAYSRKRSSGHRKLARPRGEMRRCGHNPSYGNLWYLL